MTDTTTKTDTPTGGATDGLKDALRDLGKNALNLGMSKIGDRAQGLTGRLTDFAEGKGKDKGDDAGDETAGVGAQAAGGGLKAAVAGENPAVGALKGAFSGVTDKVKGVFTGGGGSKGSKTGPKSFSNIIDSFDVGVPVRVAYNQWTQFSEWSEFMKKMRFAEVQEDDGKIRFRAKIFVLNRAWESTIIDMTPDEQIIWQSSGDKGYLNGAVTFHEIAPRLTRLCLAIEYHPKGFWEHTINIWRSVGSRVRLETKLYIHQVMTHTVLDPDSVEGWRAEIHDKEVVRTHEEVVQQEQEDAEREAQEQEDAERDENDDEYEDDDYEEGDEGDEDDDRPADEADDDRPADEADDEYEDEEDDYDDEDDDDGPYEDDGVDDRDLVDAPAARGR
jgi:hypothetical protein